MKLLVIGASGLVGSSVLRLAVAAGHQVLGTRRHQEIEGLVPLDLVNPNACRNLIEGFYPEAVICCAAWPWVDGCERNPDRARRENCTQPALLAEIAHAMGARVVYLSTSYVFDGEKGPYTEEDDPRPVNVYGQSKLDGERGVLAATEGEAIIARTMGVYGMEEQRKNFVHQVIDTLSNGKRMAVPTDQYGNVTNADDLSAMLLDLISRKESGIWNCAGPDPSICRRDFSLQIAETYNLDENLFDFKTTKEFKQKAKRPLQAGLIIKKLINLTGFKPTNWIPKYQMSNNYE